MKNMSYMEGVASISQRWDTFRPQHGVPMPALVELLQERYGFLESGFSPIAQASGLFLPSCRFGNFSYEGQNVPVHTLEFRSDGIVANCAYTPHTLAFLNDLAALLKAQYQCRPTETLVFSDFRSTIIAELEDHEAKTLEKYRAMGDLITKLSGDNGDYNFFGLKFLPTNAVNQEDAFVIEQRLPVDENGRLFFFRAKMTSDEHTKAVEAVFSALS